MGRGKDQDSDVYLDIPKSDQGIMGYESAYTGECTVLGIVGVVRIWA